MQTFAIETLRRTPSLGTVRDFSQEKKKKRNSQRLADEHEVQSEIASAEERSWAGPKEKRRPESLDGRSVPWFLRKMFAGL